MTLILKRETGSLCSGPRLRDSPSFRDFVLRRTDALSRRIAEAPGFVFEPESRVGYAAQLGLPGDDADLRDLWELYQDGEGAEYEQLHLDRAGIFACIYRHYVTALVSRHGGAAYWGEDPGQDHPAWGRGVILAELDARERLLLLENRRLARLMLMDVEIDEPYLSEEMTTYYLEVWAPVTLRRQAIDAAVDLGAGNSECARLAKLNAKMRAQVEESTAIYRWYDAARRPIYYGIAGDLAVRQDQHARTSRWSTFAAYCEVTRASTRRLALDEERRLIQRDVPVFNRQHNDTPEARDRYTLYLAEHGRLDLID